MYPRVASFAMQRIAHGDLRVKGARGSADAALHAANRRLLARRQQSQPPTRPAWGGGIVLSIEAEPEPEPTPRSDTMRVQPSLLTAMLREELAAVGRVWLLCRHLDSDGRGWLDVEQIRTELTSKESPLRVCGWRRLRQILQEGKGKLWERDDCGRLWLYSTTKAARHLGVERFEGNAVQLPITDLLNTVGRVRATFYATFHAGRDATPISRDRLATVTGVAPRTQRDYDDRLAVERVTNIALLGNQSAEDAAFKHGRATFKTRTGQQARRLPNSYRAPYRPTVINTTKKLNRRLRRDLATYGTQGNTSNSTRFERRYFDDGRRAADGAGTVYLKGVQKGGAVIWHGW